MKRKIKMLSESESGTERLILRIAVPQDAEAIAAVLAESFFVHCGAHNLFGTPLLTMEKTLEAKS